MSVTALFHILEVKVLVWLSFSLLQLKKAMVNNTAVSDRLIFIFDLIVNFKNLLVSIYRQPSTVYRAVAFEKLPVQLTTKAK
jgi:hypothetical protein